MSHNILILGGTGAMGAPLADILAEKGLSVHVTTRQNRPSRPGITYIKGSAKDTGFIRGVLAQSEWDAVVDFMAYSTDEFRRRAELMLSGTRQYVFISSARVYAKSDAPITEDTPRLLDTSQDSEYLKTDEYALAKARQEDILTSSAKGNWTIIRPSITYNDTRLQLGVLEKEGVFYRALHGRSIVFSRDIAGKVTAMTWGHDVAEGIAAIIGQPGALGQVFHITERGSYKWQEILDVYLDVLAGKLGRRPNVVMTDKAVSFMAGNKYQIIYCRYFNRRFDTSKISRFIDTSRFVDAKSGLRKCLAKFLEAPKFGRINWKLEALNDKAAGEKTPLAEIPGLKSKAVYILCRHNMAFAVNIAGKVKSIMKKIRNITLAGGGGQVNR